MLTKQRAKRHRRVRKKIFGTKEKPRLCVFRSAKNIYAQIINDELGHTLVSASSQDNEFKNGNSGGNKDAAEKIGQIIGERALKKGISAVVFDRNGYLYHGRVKCLAMGARKSGLKF